MQWHRRQLDNMPNTELYADCVQRFDQLNPQLEHTILKIGDNTLSNIC